MSVDFRRRRTRRLAPDAAGIAAAAEILRAGGLVAFPTETVYGLGANALDAFAVRGIFEAKGRPADDPLIVHLADARLVERVAVVDALATRLGAHFWPGPLTLVVPKRPNVPGEVTAGLQTVAVRVPAHAVAQALLLASGVPLAAPSANLFGRPSPTRAAHVLADLDGRIDAVVDGGPCVVGVESTIVDVSSTPPRLLRPGGLAAEAIEAVLGVRLVRLLRSAPSEGPQPAPGLMPVHYSPHTPLTLIVGAAAQARLWLEVEAAVRAGQSVGVVALEEDRGHWPADQSAIRSQLPQLPDWEIPESRDPGRDSRRGESLLGGHGSGIPSVTVEVVGTYADPASSAARLFDAIRALDARNLDQLFVRELADPHVGLGQAITDRLRRAAQRIIEA